LCHGAASPRSRHPDRAPPASEAGNAQPTEIVHCVTSSTVKPQKTAGGSDIMLPMAKNIFHISEAEAASNFVGLLTRVRAGAEIVIEGREPIVVMRAGTVRGRLHSQRIALAKAHEQETAKAPSSIPTSPRTWKRSSKTVRCGTRPRGNNPRLFWHRVRAKPA
jgi:hypothetical protein